MCPLSPGYRSRFSTMHVEAVPSSQKECNVSTVLHEAVYRMIVFLITHSIDTSDYTGDQRKPIF